MLLHYLVLKAGLLKISLTGAAITSTKVHSYKFLIMIAKWTRSGMLILSATKHLVFLFCFVEHNETKA